MADSTRYHIIDETTMANYYELTGTVYCIRETYDPETMAYAAWPDANIQTTGSLGTYDLRFDLSLSHRSIFYLKCMTKGTITDYQPFEVNVCSINALQTTSFHKTIALKTKVNDTQDGYDKQFVISYNDTIRPMWILD